MITFRVDSEQFTRSRFVLSRLVETTNGLEILLHPSRAPYARHWVKATRRRVDPSAVAVLLALVDHQSWYVPDFLVTVPGHYEPGLEEELAAVLDVSTDLVRHQLEMAFRVGPPPPAALERSRANGSGPDPRWPLPTAVAEVLDQGGERELIVRVVEELRRYWRMAMAESWPAVRRILDDDVRNQAARASQVGFADLVGNLHPGIAWNGQLLELELPYDLTLDAEPGIVLTPSVFLPGPAVWLGTAAQAMVGYPAHGRGQVWSVPIPAADSARVLGGRRAALLCDLGTPRSTAELATRHQLTPPTVSYHLTRLRNAGLVTRRQAGHSVLYVRTERAVELLTALGSAGS